MRSRLMIPGLRIVKCVMIFLVLGSIFPNMMFSSARMSAAENDKKIGRFSIEAIAGFGSMNPSDLNLILDYDGLVIEHNYDAYLNYLLSQGQILSWTKTTEGESKKIKSAFPAGFRIRYRLLNLISLSLGFQYMETDRSGVLDFTYTRNLIDNEQDVEHLLYSPYGIAATAYIPQIGIHFHLPISRRFGAEIFAAAGPLFAKCIYTSQLNYTWRILGEDYDLLTYESDTLIEEKGSGMGLALEGGGRFNFNLSREFSFFIEGGYAKFQAGSLSGTGMDVRAENTDSWEGEWKIANDSIVSPWGTLNGRFPSNYNFKGGMMEDFQLDLSGLRVRIGIAFRF